MRPFTTEELESFLGEVESDRVERKRSWSGDASEKGRQAVCAFANDLPNHQLPGVLFIGASDDGSPSGIPITDQLLTTLAGIKSDGNLLPPPVLTVERRTLRGAEMAVVTVWPADAPPVRYDGRVWIRIGPRRGVATAQDERILNEKRRHRDRTFDSRPLEGCPLSELNRLYFESEYLPRAVAADVLDANERSFEQRLASTSMIASIEEPNPTVVGVLALGNSPRTWVPGAYVQFLRIRGGALEDPVADEQEIDGALGTQLRRLDEKLKATLTVAVEFTAGEARETRSSPYPIVALQQLCWNAVMHRTYEGTNSPVRVYWFDDRIEIYNPGGPYGVVTAENFGRPGVTDYRNPNLAGVLKTLGYVQRFGVGIAAARAALAANGNPEPEFVVETNAVLATVRRAS